MMKKYTIDLLADIPDLLSLTSVCFLLFMTTSCKSLNNSKKESLSEKSAFQVTQTSLSEKTAKDSLKITKATIGTTKSGKTKPIVPPIKRLLLDTVVSQVVVVDTTLQYIRNRKPVSLKEIRYRKQILALKNHLAEERNRYLMTHELLERFMKMEVTDELLNINYYAVNSSRLGQRQEGLRLVVTSLFPSSLQQTELKNNTIKLTSAFKNAIQRYEKVSDCRLSLLNSEIQITFYGRSQRLASQVSNMLQQMGLRCSSSYVNSSSSEIQFSLISHHVFEKDFQQWQEKEREIQKEIQEMEEDVVEMGRN